MGRTTILAPHLDDAALSCWHQLEQPGAQVVTIFAGIPESDKRTWWDRLAGHKDGASAMQARREENQAALAGTAAAVINLDFLDRQYAPSPRNVADIVSAAEDQTNRDDHFIAAAGIGTFLRRHPDHVTTREVGLELLRRGRTVLFYADLPYMLPLRNFADWPQRIKAEKVKRALGVDVGIETYELSPAQQQRKQAAVRAYASQFKPVNMLALGALTRPGAYRFEVLFKPV